MVSDLSLQRSPRRDFGDDHIAKRDMATALWVLDVVREAPPQALVQLAVGPATPIPGNSSDAAVARNRAGSEPA